MQILEYPLDVNYILRKKKSLLRTLRDQEGLVPIRIAILGGSSTQDVVSLLELFLLNNGYKPAFYEADFNRYYETIMYSNDLLDFSPDIIYLHTSSRNLKWLPSGNINSNEIEDGLNAEMNQIEQLISTIKKVLIVQSSLITLNT